MTELTPEQAAEQMRLVDMIIDEILNEEGIKELEGLDLQERQQFRIPGYMESDNDFLAYGHNLKAAAILLGIYLRVKTRRST